MTLPFAGWPAPRQVIAIAIMLVATGCIKHTPYVTPAVDMTPAFKEDPNWKVAAPADGALKGSWWEAFGDDQLNALENQVAVSNQTLKSAESQFLSARAAVRIARSAFGPQVSAAPTVVLQRQSANRAVSTFHDSYGDFLLPIDVSYEADV